MSRKNKSKVIRRRAQAGADDNTFVRSRTIRNQDLITDKKNRARELERQTEKKRKNRRRKVSVVLIGLLVLLLLAVFAASQFIYSIGNIHFHDSLVKTDVDEDNYTDSVNEYLAAYPSSRFGFLLHRDAFSDFMIKQHPEILAVDVMLNPFRSADVNIILRQPVAVWQTADGSKYVDKSGVTFYRNWLAEPSVVIKDESSLDVDGSTVTSSRFLSFVGQIISGVNDSGVGKAESVVIPLGAIRYVELRLINHVYPIKIQIDRDIASQVGDITSIVKYLDDKKIVPSYVDVRVEHKGYYK